MQLLMIGPVVGSLIGPPYSEGDKTPTALDHRERRVRSTSAQPRLTNPAMLHSTALCGYAISLDIVRVEGTPRS